MEMKPEEIEYPQGYNDIAYGMCPNCGEHINDFDYFNRCPNCGQKLNWS